MGAEGAILHLPALPGEYRWEYEDLVKLREHVESFGLTLVALENTPWSFYDRAMLGLPGTDEQIEHYRTTVRNIGRRHRRAGLLLDAQQRLDNIPRVAGARRGKKPVVRSVG